MAYFPLLDVLRFIAALGVMCFHYFSGSTQSPTNPFAFFIAYGYLGVQLFFIISGFVIHGSLHRPTKEFALGRFLRIYPLFWVLCTITYVSTLIFTYDHALSFVTFLKNLLIINNGQTAFMVDGSYWTLTIELLFYAYIGFFTWLFSTRRLEWFYDGWLFISLAVFFFHVDGFIISKLLLVRYASFFIFGGTIALLLETWKTSAPWRRIRLIVVLIISALAPLYISYILQQEYSTFTNYFGVLTAYSALIVESFFILVPLALYMSRHISKGKLFTLAKILGGITYPLYLLHQRLGSIIIEKFGVFGLVSIYSVLTACGMIIVSYFISQYEEKSRKKLFKKLVTVKSTQVT